MVDLKAVVYPEDFFEMVESVVKSRCMNLTAYSYRCYRERDNFNNPYGPFLARELEMTVKASVANNCMYFYNAMDENRSQVFSIIFDPVFNAYGRLTSFKDGLVVRGFVVDMLEACDNEDDSGDEQLRVRIKLALSKISYLGMESVHELEIRNEE